jgi:2,4-dienoyl-CoA reductase-like NADH-dependent reductase (Old Yellow Enzyme family)
MSTTGSNREQIAGDIDAGLADMAALGRFALANPDVVERMRAEAPLNEVNRATSKAAGRWGTPTTQPWPKSDQVPLSRPVLNLSVRRQERAAP